jgi:hypothetical protein
MEVAHHFGGVFHAGIGIQGAGGFAHYVLYIHSHNSFYCDCFAANAFRPAPRILAGAGLQHHKWRRRRANPYENDS